MKTPGTARFRILLLLAGGLALAGLPAESHAAGLFERLGFTRKNPPGSTNAATAAALTGLSQDQIASGLKEALGKGVQSAVAGLGRTDGFLQDLDVKIPMPENLQKVERALRTLRQDALADEFVTTMNRAAEKAVPEAAAVLGQALQQMTLEDAKGILTGTNNAATLYFRRTAGTNLQERFLPIVKQATEQAGVTRAYKQMVDKAQGGALGGFGTLGTSLLGLDTVDLDAYVTSKSLDGLFFKIAAEEKRIRETAAARTTDLLQKVFGAVEQKVGAKP